MQIEVYCLLNNDGPPDRKNSAAVPPKWESKHVNIINATLLLFSCQSTSISFFKDNQQFWKYLMLNLQMLLSGYPVLLLTVIASDYTSVG